MKFKIITISILAALATAAYAYVKCSACNGTGWNGNLKCYPCGGDGKVGN